MSQKAKLAYVIMRTQGFTKAHLHLIKEAHKRADHVLVLVGSANRSPSLRNPFSYTLRKDMIRSSLHGALLFATNIVPLGDYCHMELDWESRVKKLVRDEMKQLKITDNKDVVMVVHEKDETTYYSKYFKCWDKKTIESFGDYNATDLRNLWLDGKDCEHLSTPEAMTVLNEWKAKGTKFGFEWLRGQRDKVNAYKKDYEHLPYGINFITGDALVVCEDNILLVRRKADAYGGSLWALPGGFKQPGEKAENAVFRELIEETTIDVPTRALRQGFRGLKMFEGGNRDDRGDFTTHCGIFFLERNRDGTLPNVKGADDVDLAKWFELDKLPTDRMMFLDHKFIIEVMRRTYMSGGYRLDV